MADLCFNHPGDPFANNAITDGEYPHVQSAGYSGTDYDDITAPATPNYPFNNPARYFIELPQIPNITALSGARPWLMKDVTNAVTLTRVSGSPGANQYRYVTDHTGIYRPQIVELNASQAGAVIAFDYYGEGTIINANLDGIFNIRNGVKSDGNYISQILTSANSSIIFSNLDYNNEGGFYEIILKINGANASTQSILVEINDVVNTGYLYIKNGGENGGSYSASYENSIGYVGSNRPYVIRCYINCIGSKLFFEYRHIIPMLNDGGHPGYLKVDEGTIAAVFDVDNITKIKFKTTGNLFDIGTEAILIKRRI